MNDSLGQYPDLVQRIKHQALTPRNGKPADIAAMAAFLAADESEYITGHAYSVDGGHLAQQPQMSDMKPFEAQDPPAQDEGEARPQARNQPNARPMNNRETRNNHQAGRTG